MTEAFGTDGQAASAGQNGSQGVTVSFAEQFEASKQFEAIFKEGMGLVESTASYLDGAGRKQARALKGPASVAYATESMRLTTRLLELASWLLVRRALKDGDISADEAKAKRRRMKLDSIGRPSHVKHFSELPPKLCQLIEQSFALQDRIIKLDRAIESTAADDSAAAEPATGRNPVADHMAQIEAAFGG